MLDCFLDGLIDTLRVFPFLLVSFYIIELLEHKINSNKKLEHSGKYGPILGSILGIIPQCGIASIATNLYVTGIITLGTLISVFLSTSDEMIPILLSEKVNIKLILIILGIKLLVGLISGLLIDLIHPKKITTHYEVCKEEHCHCEEHLLISAFKHTLNITLFILIINIVLNFIFEFSLNSILNNIFLQNSFLSPLVTSLIGLIPNCASSIVITKLYLASSISFGSMISGLLTNSGIALVILFKTNKDKKENFIIIGLTYLISIVIGIILNLLHIAF